VSTDNTKAKKVPKLPFDPAVVQDIYRDELSNGTKKPPSSRIVLLELGCYLENFLWPNFVSPSMALSRDKEKAGGAETKQKETLVQKVPISTYEHVMSIILMVNEKFRENVAAWTCFEGQEEKFAALVDVVLDLPTFVLSASETHKKEMTILEKSAYLMFLVNAFQSLETEIVRKNFLPLASLPAWQSLSKRRLEYELKNNPQMIRHWDHLQARVRRRQEDLKTLMPEIVQIKLAQANGVAEAVEVVEEAKETPTKGKRKGGKAKGSSAKKAKGSAKKAAPVETEESKKEKAAEETEKIKKWLQLRRDEREGVFIPLLINQVGCSCPITFFSRKRGLFSAHHMSYFPPTCRFPICYPEKCPSK
jgi:hypothetical protein